MRCLSLVCARNLKVLEPKMFLRLAATILLCRNVKWPCWRHGKPKTLNTFGVGAWMGGSAESARKQFSENKTIYQLERGVQSSSTRFKFRSTLIKLCKHCARRLGCPADFYFPKISLLYPDNNNNNHEKWATTFNDMYFGILLISSK